MKARVSGVLIIALLAIPVALWAYHDTGAARYAPTWLTPPPAVLRAFEAVVPVRPVIKTPDGTPLADKEIYVLSSSATGSFIGHYVVTAAHVTVHNMTGMHNQQDQRTGALFLWKRKEAPMLPLYINTDADIAIFPLGAYNPPQRLALATEERISGT
jgi:hypothetical protein